MVGNMKEMRVTSSPYGGQHGLCETCAEGTQTLYQIRLPFDSDASLGSQTQHHRYDEARHELQEISFTGEKVGQSVGSNSLLQG